MTTANKITLTRIAMIPFFIYFAAQPMLIIDELRYLVVFPTSTVIALVLFCVASFTDFLDGYVARKYNQVTDFGKFVDPLADKLLVASALILFVEQKAMAGWMVCVILARELIITSLRVVAANKGVVMAATWTGKVKTCVQIGGIIVIYLYYIITGALANGVAWYYKEKGQKFVYRCINRLDRDTSGLTIVAKHYVSAGMLSAMIANKATSGITREYLAIAKGSVRPLEGTITAPLGRKEGSIIERTVDFENGESAVTHYRVLDEKNGHSLVSLILETGRTHQIRIHMKYLGYPLIGDYLYNPDMEQIQRQALHAWKLSFVHPITGEKMQFTAPLPEDMAAVLYP